MMLGEIPYLNFIDAEYVAEFKNFRIDIFDSWSRIYDWNTCKNS